MNKYVEISDFIYSYGWICFITISYIYSLTQCMLVCTHDASFNNIFFSRLNFNLNFMHSNQFRFTQFILSGFWIYQIHIRDECVRCLRLSKCLSNREESRKKKKQWELYMKRPSGEGHGVLPVRMQMQWLQWIFHFATESILYFASASIPLVSVKREISLFEQSVYTPNKICTGFQASDICLFTLLFHLLYVILYIYYVVACKCHIFLLLLLLLLL